MTQSFLKYPGTIARQLLAGLSSGTSKLLGLPPIILAEGMALVLAVVATTWVSAVPGNFTRVEVALAPISVSEESALSWHEQVDQFAVRLETAFGVDEEESADYAAWIIEASARQELPAELVASLIYIESNFRDDAVSSVGAVGPAQIIPRFWEGSCGGDLLDPKFNVYCGAQVLAHYMEQCGTFRCALERYNVGPRNAVRDVYAGARARYVSKVNDSLALIEPVSSVVLL